MTKVEHIHANANVITDTVDQGPKLPTGSSGRVRCNLSGETGEAARSSPWTRDRDLDALYGLRVVVRRDALFPRRERDFSGTISSVPHYLRENAIPHYFVLLENYPRGFFFNADDLLPVDMEEARQRLELDPLRLDTHLPAQPSPWWLCLLSAARATIHHHQPPPKPSATTT